MARERKSVLRQLLVNIIGPLVLFILLYCAYGYYSERKKLFENIDSQLAQLTRETQNLTAMYDYGMLAHESSFTSRMKETAERIKRDAANEKLSLDKADLFKLSEKLGLDTMTESIYIINREGIVCNTTYRKDQGLDFNKLDSNLKRRIDKIFASNEFSCDRFGLEVSTRLIKKYAYLRSADDKFLIELGFRSAKAIELRDILLGKINEISSSYASFRNIEFEILIKDVKAATFDPKYFDVYNKAIREKKSQELVEEINGEKVIQHFIYIDIKNADLYDGYILQVTTDDRLEKELLKKELWKFILLLVIFILPLTLLVLFRARKIISPIKRLTQKTRIIKDGNLDERAVAEGGREIAELSENFNHMVDQLQESYRGLEQKVKDRTSELHHQKEIVEEKQKEIIDSIRYARRIQVALITSETYIKKFLPESFIFYKPKDIVSGDFYWAIDYRERFYLLVADCTGHGVPGAFMSLLNISIINEIIVVRNIFSPDRILDEARKEIIRALNPEGSEEESKDGMDCILCSFDTENNSLEYAAANNSFYHIRDGEIRILKADKMPVGKSPMEAVPFTKNKVELQKGDLIATLTDGFADQFGGPKGKKFKYKPLEEIILANRHLPMEEQKNILSEKFESWKGDLEQVDDVLLIGIKIAGLPKRINFEYK